MAPRAGPASSGPPGSAGGGRDGYEGTERTRHGKGERLFEQVLGIKRPWSSFPRPFSRHVGLQANSERPSSASPAIPSLSVWVSAIMMNERWLQRGDTTTSIFGQYATFCPNSTPPCVASTHAPTHNTLPTESDALAVNVATPFADSPALSACTSDASPISSSDVAITEFNDLNVLAFVATDAASLRFRTTTAYSKLPPGVTTTLSATVACVRRLAPRMTTTAAAGPCGPPRRRPPVGLRWRLSLASLSRCFGRGPWTRRPVLPRGLRRPGPPRSFPPVRKVRSGPTLRSTRLRKARRTGNSRRRGRSGPRRSQVGRAFCRFCHACQAIGTRASWQLYRRLHCERRFHSQRAVSNATPEQQHLARLPQGGRDDAGSRPGKFQPVAHGLLEVIVADPLSPHFSQLVGAPAWVAMRRAREG